MKRCTSHFLCGLLGVATGLSLSGCMNVIAAALPPGGVTVQTERRRGDVKPNLGLIYFYRIKEFVGNEASFQLKEDGLFIQFMGNGTYGFFYATPGKHTYSAKTEVTSSVVIDVEPGKTYYIQSDATIGFVASHANLTLPDEADAESKMKLLSYATLSARP